MSVSFSKVVAVVVFVKNTSNVFVSHRINCLLC